MAETKDYIQSLTAALAARAGWLEESELVKLKEDLRDYQSSFSSLYTIYLKKGLINEDPYKQETKIGELQAPDSGDFSEAERLDQLSMRLSNYDTQLDFLVNFYQFSVEFLNLDRIKRILALVRYVDWVQLSPDSQSPVTRAVAELTSQAKVGIDQIALRIIGESLTKLSKSTEAVLGCLKELTAYNREAFKLKLRTTVTGNMGPQEAQTAVIKKKYAAAAPGSPFYPDLAEELIREDYSKDGPAMREKILKSLKIPERETKAAVKKVSYKDILLEGAAVIGSVSAVLSECGAKLDENEILLASRKRGFWEKIRHLMQQIMSKVPEEVVYDLEFMDPTRGTPVKEKLNYRRFRGDMEKRIHILAGLAARGAAYSRLAAMEEEQIIAWIEKNIRDMQNVHKTLVALDEYFKSEAGHEERGRIKGIKPELSTIKNAILRANQLRHEYSARKEEEEQMRRLGINADIQQGAL
ncbi:MAG: hypothetical protein LBG42_05050 [Treponema sp.]|jgi:hypothetical protein|nr:hypothetical protein [Treponema sp.]